MRTGIGRTLTLLGIFLGVWVGARVLLPLILPFLLGLGLASAAEPMVRFLTRRLRLPRGAAAGIAVSVTFCFLAVAVGAVCALVFREIGVLARILPDLGMAAKNAAAGAEQWLLNVSSRSPEAIRPLLRKSISNTLSDGTALVDKGLSFVLNFAGNMLSRLPDSALTVGTAIISGYMISAKFPRLKRGLLRKLPRQRLRSALAALRQLKDTLLQWLLAQLKLSAATYGILLLSFFLLRVPYPPLTALAVALVDAFPVLGVGTVLLPWSLICLLQGSAVRAAGLTAVYVIIAVSRSVLEPRVLGKHLGLDPLAALAALYAGYKLWGIGGMLLSPVLAVTAMQLFPATGRQSGN